MKRYIIAIFLLLFFSTRVEAIVESLDLDSIIKIGLEQNSDLKIKRIELEAAEKDIKIANKLKNPQLQSNIMLGNISNGNASVAGATLPIEVLKRGIRKKHAKTNYSIKEVELKQAEHNFKIEIMRAYFDILYAKSVYQITEERLRLFEDLVRITTNRPKNSKNFKIDNLKADMQYEQQKINLNIAKANMLSKQFELNRLLNTGNDKIMYDTKEVGLFGDWAFLYIEVPDYNFLENIALQYSYKVKISQKNIDKSEEEVSLAKHQRIPDLNIAGGYAWQHHTSGAYIGGGLDVPILYNYTPEIDKAKLYLEKSKANKKAYEYQLKYELKKDFNNFKYSAENMEHSKQILKDAEAIVKLVTEGYILGKNTYTDLIINENGHQEILGQYLNTMSKHFSSYLDLMEDIGHDILIEDELL